MNIIKTLINDKKKATQSYSILLLISLTFFLSSCEKDYLFNEEISQELEYNIQIKDGRMFFNSKEELQEVFETIKEKNDEELYKDFNQYFSKDFQPLRPIVTDDNEQEIYEIYVNKEKQLKLDYREFFKNEERAASYNIFDHIDDLEDIVGDDAFALFIDTNGEIQVGNQIYKYTDAGLFIVTDNDYDALNNYLNTKSISRTLLIPTNEGVIYNFVTVIVPNGGHTQLTSSIEYYRTPGDEPYIVDANDDENTGGGGSTGGGSTGGGNSSNGNGNGVDLDGLDDYLENLTLCDSHSGLFGDLFGDNKICIDKYENKKRVKTKAFNYNYILVYHVGVKVKHQKKGWTGIWRRESTDKVALGVETAQFEYDYTPILHPATINLNPQSIKYSYKPLNIRYNVQSGIFNFPNGGAPYTYLSQETFVSTNFYPRVFWDDLTIELFNFDNILDNAIDIGEKEVTSQRLNELFWDNVYKNAKSQLRGLANDNDLNLPKGITFAYNYPNQGKLLVQKTAFEYCSNCSRKTKTFDFNGAAQVGISFNGSTGDFSYSAGAGELIAPESLRIKMYGAIKRNGVWHGSKLNIGFE